jgi:hypothetical protein
MFLNSQLIESYYYYVTISISFIFVKVFDCFIECSFVIILLSSELNSFSFFVFISFNF